MPSGQPFYNVSFDLVPLVSQAKLNQDSDIRVPEEEVARLGRENEAVHFPDGGYFGMMTVHHDLHCLVRSLLEDWVKRPEIDVRRCASITTCTLIDISLT
jgi:hypothetical protein